MALFMICNASTGVLSKNLYIQKIPAEKNLPFEPSGPGKFSPQLARIFFIFQFLPLTPVDIQSDILPEGRFQI